MPARKSLENLRWVWPIADKEGSFTERTISYSKKTQQEVIPITVMENAGLAGQYVCAPISGTVTHIEDNKELGGQNIEIATRLGDIQRGDDFTVSNFFIGVLIDNSKVQEGYEIVQGEWIGRPRRKSLLGQTNWQMITAEAVAEGIVFAVAAVAIAPEVVFAEGLSFASRLAFLMPAYEPRIAAVMLSSMVPVIPGTRAAYQYFISDDTPLPIWMTWVHGGAYEGTYVWPQGLADVGKGFVYLSQKQGNPDKYKEFSTQNLSELDPIERGDPRSKPRPPKQVNPLLMFGAAAAAYFYFKGK